MKRFGFICFILLIFMSGCSFSNQNSGVNEASTNEVSTNEVSTNEATTNEATTNEVSTNEVSTNESITDEATTNDSSNNYVSSYTVITDDSDAEDLCLNTLNSFAQSNPDLKGNYFTVRYDYDYILIVVSKNREMTDMVGIWEKIGDNPIEKTMSPGSAYREPCLEGIF